MLHQFWRLSESGENNLGLAVTADGLVLGRTPLIERRDNNFMVREGSEIEHLLRRAYRTELTVDRLMPGLATVAAALNANDQCLARIAAVHLRIPDLPDKAARDYMEAEDSFIKSGHRNSVLGSREIRKASPDDPKHPGWPAGTEDGLGGKFRPKDGSAAAITQEIKNRITRHELRLNLVAALHVGIEAMANLIPGIDVAANVAMAADIARIFSEYSKLAIDATVALDFVKDGPHALDELQVLSDYEEFSSYDQFVKSESSRDRMVKRFGGAGAGNQYHHIVTQGGANAGNFSSQQLQNTEVIIRLPTLLHEIVNDEYSGPSPDGSKMTLYEWLQTQPYDVQRQEGLRILRELHILK